MTDSLRTQTDVLETPAPPCDPSPDDRRVRRLAATARSVAAALTTLCVAGVGLWLVGRVIEWAGDVLPWVLDEVALLWCELESGFRALLH